MTGEFDPALVIKFLKDMQADPTGQTQAAWVEFERELMDNRVYIKYQNLISKGLFITDAEVDQEYIESNRKYNFDYISKRFTTVNDTLVEISEKDIEDYYLENQDEYKQEASRDISYVTFDVIASEQDSANVRQWINDQKAELERIESAEQYIRLNSDAGFDPVYYNPSDLEVELQSWVDTANIGSVYGPYKVGGTWKLARITDIKQLPDSVRASHIVLPPDQNNSLVSARETIDSLKTLVENGADFASLAAEFGTDATKDRGGDLDWFVQGQMVQPFNDSCFYGNKGDVMTLTTSFGVHLVKITDQAPRTRKYQVGILSRNIVPSQDTYQKFYSEASRFASTYGNAEDFEAGIDEMNLARRVANNLAEGDRAISGLENPRELIRWTYEAKKGSISPIFEFGDRYVIARLDEVRDEGIAKLDQVYGEVETAVRNMKKAEYLKEEFSGIDKSIGLDGIAGELKTTVKNVENASFSSLSIPGIGVEPAVSAAMTSIPEGEISDPIIGKNGVYIIKISSVQNPEGEANVLATRERLQQSLSSRAGFQARQALENKADVVDKRNKFY
jgi:peptidyl-prolyl cis-trans isomerase D